MYELRQKPILDICCKDCKRFEKIRSNDSFGTCDVVVDMTEYVPKDAQKRIVHHVKESYPYNIKSKVLVGEDFGCKFFIKKQ